MRTRVRPYIMRLACVVLFMLMMTAGTAAFGASADISFTASAGEIRVGETLTVELTITAEVFPGDFEGYITYNPDVLEYAGGPDCIAGGEGILRVCDLVTGSDKNIRKYILTFNAIARGYSDITMRGEPELYEFEAGYLMSVSCQGTAVQVLAQSMASSDASLSALKISPGTLMPEFSSDVTVYNARVDAATEKLVIGVETTDANASVVISGNEALREGTNIITITVTAEDGTECVYMVNAIKDGNELPEQNDAENPAETQPDEEVAADWNFTAANRDGEVYIIADTVYRVCSILDGVAVPQGYIKTSVIINGLTITAYSPEDNLESDYLLLILQKDDNPAGLYSYDRVEKTIQRYRENTDAVTTVVQSGFSTIELQELTESYEKSLGSLTLIIAVLSALCMILLLVVIRMAIKNRNTE